MVAVCEVEIFIPVSHSLKDKRQVVKSIMDRIRSRCNASVAEIDLQDIWQRAVIQIAMVGSGQKILESQVTLARRIIDDVAEAEISTFDVEYI